MDTEIQISNQNDHPNTAHSIIGDDISLEQLRSMKVEMENRKKLMGKSWSELHDVMSRYHSSLVLKHEQYEASLQSEELGYISQLEKKLEKKSYDSSRSQKTILDLESRLLEKDSEIVRLRTDNQKMKNEVMMKNNLLDKLQEQMALESMEYSAEIAALRETFLNPGAVPGALPGAVPGAGASKTKRARIESVPSNLSEASPAPAPAIRRRAVKSVSKSHQSSPVQQSSSTNNSQVEGESRPPLVALDPPPGLIQQQRFTMATMPHLTLPTTSTHVMTLTSDDGVGEGQGEQSYMSYEAGDNTGNSLDLMQDLLASPERSEVNRLNSDGQGQGQDPAEYAIKSEPCSEISPMAERSLRRSSRLRSLASIDKHPPKKKEQENLYKTKLFHHSKTTDIRTSWKRFRKDVPESLKKFKPRHSNNSVVEVVKNYSESSSKNLPSDIITTPLKQECKSPSSKTPQKEFTSSEQQNLGVQISENRSQTRAEKLLRESGFVSKFEQISPPVNLSRSKEKFSSRSCRKISENSSKSSAEKLLRESAFVTKLEEVSPPGKPARTFPSPTVCIYYRCPQCLVKFDEYEAFRAHESEHGTTSNIPSGTYFKCGSCGATFKEKSAFKRHYWQHYWRYCYLVVKSTLKNKEN